jgi:hypothetical protein
MSAGEDEQQDPVRGLAVAEGGLKLELEQTELPRGRATELRFRVVDSQDRPVREFEVEHDKRMHLILARRDLTGFQHLHPELEDDGTWRTDLTVPEAGSYRVFADFKHRGENRTLAADLAVDGEVDWRTLPPVETTAKADGAYEVRLDAAPSRAGEETELRFTVTRDGERVELEPYLGAGGHLVALREGDLAYLHVHPTGHAAASGEIGDSVVFASEFPSEGRYRLFLQFKHAGRVHTAAFTREALAASGGGGQSSDEPKGAHHGE